MPLRKTKIVCTIGPAVRDQALIQQLLVNGMNIARFNFSHGDHAYHLESMKIVREASHQTGIPVALLLDTKGPEIRTGHMKNEQTVQLITGKHLIITTDDVEGTEECISISYKNLPYEITPGKHIYIADGVIDLEVESVQGHAIHCLIRQGGDIGSRKNVNVIGVRTALPAITEKDEQDILFGIEQQVDFIAASFIRRSSDILEIRKILDPHQSNIHVIAKIEDEEGVENIDDIINVSNGIMIARGDLGVQLKTEDIPLVQKRIIQKCNAANKPVITATQMLDSMIHNPRPTRAEASDVANAIFDGTDAVMLSGETASGAYPVQAVHTMHNIARAVENSQEYPQKMRDEHYESNAEHDIATAIARSAFFTADQIHASAIITPTLRGNTPKRISKYRPQQHIIAVTPSEAVQRNLLLYWGVHPIITNQVSSSDTMTNNAITIALRKQYVHNGDKVVMVAGIPLHSPVMLNTIRVHVIATILAKGAQGTGKLCTGKIVIAENMQEARLKTQFRRDAILVAKTLDTEFAILLPQLTGIILEDYSTLPFDDIIAQNPAIVVITGVTHALTLFEDDSLVSLDGEEKLIYEGAVEEK